MTDGKHQSYRSVGDNLFSRAVARRVFSAKMSLTSVFGMGTGVTNCEATASKLNNETNNGTYLG